MNKHAWLPGVLSGILLGITTIGHGPVYHLHWAIFFGFVPLWAYWYRAPGLRAVLFSGWLCQLTFTLIAFHWIAYTVNEFSHLGLAASVLVMLLYCSCANLQFPVAGWIWHRWFRGGPLPASVAALALLTAACQRVGTSVFHWNFGYAWLYMGWPAFQLADVTGFRWLCTVTICLNGILLLAWIRRSLLYAGLGAVIFAALNLAGAWHLRSFPAADAVAKVLFVQPNVGNRDKEKLDSEPDSGKYFLQRYFALTDRALAVAPVKPDFVVWPENGFPGYIADSRLDFGMGPSMRDYLRSRRIDLLTGGFGMNLAGQTTNGLFALSKEGTWLTPAYEKRLLLPFGEYVPAPLAFLKSRLPDVRDYGAGSGPVVLRLGGMKLGAEICYEGLFDFIARDLARAGAELIVNVTNDSWYGPWLEPWQHFYITMAKAVETRRPFLRDTNTGVSSVTLADGTILEQSPIGKEWFHLYEIPYRTNPPLTAYSRWGYWFDWAFIAAGLIAALAWRLRRAR